MSVSVYRGAYAEPLHLEAAKSHLRVMGDDDDTVISSLIAAAREHVETLIQRRLVTCTLRLTLDRFPPRIELPFPPLVSVSSIQYVDGDGVTRTVLSDEYQIDQESEPARIEPAYAGYWPGTRNRLNAVTVTYVAGYATPVSIAVSTDVMTLLGDRTLANGDVVRFSVSGGVLPKPLAGATDYHVVSAVGSTFKVSLTHGGPAVDLIDAGAGQVFLGELPEQALAAMRLLVGHWYENREAASVDRLGPVPMAVESLCLALRAF